MSEPVEVTADLLRGMPLPFASDDSDKEDRGRVLVVGGSAEVPGAVRLAAEAALQAGAGKLQIAVPKAIAAGLALIVPEARVYALLEESGEIAPRAAEAVQGYAAECGAVLVGPGMIDKELARAFTSRLLAGPPGATFVLDAAAMNCADDPELICRHEGRMILTPHAGEMANLTGQTKEAIEAAPAAAATKAAAHLRAVVAVKGEHTFIAGPDGRCWVHRGGCVGLGTSGSGDVLAGLIAGLLARGAAPEVATLWGVFLHGQAGARLSDRIGRLGFLARQISREVPALMNELSE